METNNELIEKYKLGLVIARRRLEFMDDGLEKQIIIKIGKPRRQRDTDSGYYCPFVIVGIGKGNIQVAFGEDSVQSIELAFNMIGALMKVYYQRLYPNQITWNNDSRLGFPLPDTPEELLKKERQWMKKMKNNSRLF
jgi:hypothetical protein